MWVLLGKKRKHVLIQHTAYPTVKPVFFACPLFRDPDEFAKITGREYIF